MSLGNVVARYGRRGKHSTVLSKGIGFLMGLCLDSEFHKYFSVCLFVFRFVFLLPYKWEIIANFVFLFTQLSETLIIPFRCFLVDSFLLNARLAKNSILVYSTVVPFSLPILEAGRDYYHLM